MSEKKKSNLSEERKKVFKKDIKEGLEGLKKLLIAAIAIVLKAADSLPQSKDRTSITRYKEDPNKDPTDNAISPFKGAKNNNESEPLEVSIEVETPPSTNFRRIINTFLYPILAGISTTSLLIGTIKIGPVIQWAKTQNECVERTKILNNEGISSIAQKVMRCNGGHEN